MYFPVFVKGAKLSMGDMHFSQGDTGLALMVQPITLLVVGLVSGRVAQRVDARLQTAASLLLLAAAIIRWNMITVVFTPARDQCF